ncbi:ras GTPase-activating-like protein IQGAP1 [Macrosteles quadrilineatus]|uniref:ras GTPase-activating-like protein IQGAP1 n=1 Tax=Macrosteles quadrilineatus TaxID=74068 RepID=UPI0023E338B3|nr:ras GTPase-activating-like protein IQGAP1 [Macrosteles quadrilineatus]
MDEIRQKQVAYEYLCHLEEARKWMEAVLREELPPCTELEEYLRNGVILAKLGNIIAPETVPKNRIYDQDLKRYRAAGLHFRHTDNINYWIKSLKTVKLPLTFQPETTDVYDKKNMPRVIYCVHALSSHLFKLGKAPQIQDLYGKITFTDEEITVMSSELQKYGVQLPAFQKIGGLLAKELPGDSAALHAAVIAINQAVDAEDSQALLTSLQNRNAKLEFVLTEYLEKYAATLKTAKAAKVEAALNRSLNDSYVADVYDELLTQAELQGHINSVNVGQKWNEVLDIVAQNDPDRMSSALASPCLQLMNVEQTNGQFYEEGLRCLVESGNWIEYEESSEWRKVMQEIVNNGNISALTHRRRTAAVVRVNEELAGGSVDGLLAALSNPALDIDSELLTEFAAPLYWEEMVADRMDCGHDLTLQDIKTSVRVLSQIAALSSALDSKSHDRIWTKLMDLSAILRFEGLDPSLQTQYCKGLIAGRNYKLLENIECTILNSADVQDCIRLVNSTYEENKRMIDCLQCLNTAVRERSQTRLWDCLQDPTLHLADRTTLHDSDLPLILNLLQNRLDEQAEGVELWLEDVKSAIREAHSLIDEAQTACRWLSEVNSGLSNKNRHKVVDALCNMPGYSVQEPSQCYQRLLAVKSQKRVQSKCTWITHRLQSGQNVFLNLDTLECSWTRPYGYNNQSCHLDFSEIQNTIEEYERSVVQARNRHHVERSVIRLQARCRGYLVRKHINDRLQHFRHHEQQVVSIQRWWRNEMAKRRRRENAAKLPKKRSSCKWTELNNSEQSRKRVLEYYKPHEKKIVKIQAVWRGCKARRAFVDLLQTANPSFKVVRLFLHLLDFSIEDYHRELQLQTLKEQVVQAIRHNKQLAQQIDKMDVTIGLLVQNRISLQDAVKQGKSLSAATQGQSGGLKALSAASHNRLQGYQHLFYFLQTRPQYLAKLIFCLPERWTHRFLSNVILTLFHYGAHHREEYLLLRLFRFALQEEIRCKFSKPADVTTGDPLVLRMVVNYARQRSGQNALQFILGPLIEKLLADKHVSIDTNPVAIYNQWRNQQEMSTGKPSDLPTGLNQEQALGYQEVRDRLADAISTLKSTAARFLQRITESKQLIPYGLLFTAKELKSALHAKFPDAQEKEILKVVGNLIYYKFINPSIVAPETYEIISLPAEKTLTTEQRHTLASIAKILQFASAKKGFGEESKHLMVLNPFLIECHEKLKVFFKSCCDVEDLETHFNVSEFSEATLISRPSVVITIEEVCNMHQFVFDYANEIAPDPLDPLHELLEDVGPVPTVPQLMGHEGEELTGEVIKRLGQTEFCLHLTDKFEVPQDNTDTTKMFIKAKELAVSVMPYLSGHNLPGALRLESTAAQEEAFTRRQANNRAEAINCSLHNILDDQPSSLKECKSKLRKYLSKLDEAGLVSRDDGYQTILSAIAADISNKGRYRQIQSQELQNVKMTKQTLLEKTRFYEEQADYYNKYIKTCLENLNAGKRNVHKKSGGRKVKTQCLKYSGAKLHDKGVLVSVEGLPSQQYKNIMFEIRPTENHGVFSVCGKFMGVEMETIEIDIQNLLQLQFEGVSVMDIFNKAKININLLLYLLNTKFYKIH